MTKLTLEQWSRLETLFGDATTLTPTERARFVGQSACDDPAVHAELEALVAAFEEIPPSFLNDPVLLTLPPGALRKRRRQRAR